jgi:hypothetical protein
VCTEKRNVVPSRLRHPIVKRIVLVKGLDPAKVQSGWLYIEMSRAENANCGNNNTAIMAS